MYPVSVSNILFRLGLKCLLICVFCLLFQISTAQEHRQFLRDLSGVWKCQLDSLNIGENDRWYTKELSGEIFLPGSTDEHKIGNVNHDKNLDKLTRSFTFYGPVWYQKVIDIPVSWEGKNLQLFLERVMWESRVWIDSLPVGTQESLCVPHKYNLGSVLRPGKHKITIRVDNRYRYNIGVASEGRMGSPMWTMAVTDESQTTWNGIIGKMELKATDEVWIDRFEVHPNFKLNQIKLFVDIRNNLRIRANGKIAVTIFDSTFRVTSDSVSFVTKTLDSPILGGSHAPLLSQLAGDFYDEYALRRVEIIMPLNKEIRRWDEFSPATYSVRIALSAQSGVKRFEDEYYGQTGFRQFDAEEGALKLNGREVFLRGNQDNCIHPLTGYPPMDLPGWLTFLSTYQSYGLNHMRFHSWCPPEAAFTAADMLGMILQVEAPMWDGYGDVGKLKSRAAFIRDESERILDEYGNHPSFCMYSLGNELGPGTELYLQYVIEVLRARDKRRLYTCASAPASDIRNDDFVVGANGITGDWACSLSETCFRGLKQWKGRNDGDVRDQIKFMSKPLIAHEIGQFTSFPDFYSWFVSKKYTGPLKAYYIDTFKTSFEKNFDSKLGSAFSAASGQLQLALYKAEIEIMLRTPNLDGFHLNGLSDYPGEGVALIGILDAMLDWKGIVSAAEFRQFCSETVPLVRMEKAVWNSGDELNFTCEVRHHGSCNLENSIFSWIITDANGALLSQGKLSPTEIKTGKLNNIGKISYRLPEVEIPGEYTLSLSLDGQEIKNHWRFWVYPKKSAAMPNNNAVVITRAWDETAKRALRAGKNVVIFSANNNLKNAVPTEFSTVFWSKSAKSKRVGALGTYCDPAAAALEQFPTRSHADWQWFDLLTNAYAIDVSKFRNLQPTVYLIDFFKDNRKLAMLLEARVGNGRLMICTLNVGSDNNRSLSQNQMFRSLIGYAGSEKFKPSITLPISAIDNLFQSE